MLMSEFFFLNYKILLMASISVSVITTNRVKNQKNQK